MIKKIIIISIFTAIFLVPMFSLFAADCKQTEGAIVLEVPIPGMYLEYNSTCGNYEFVGDKQGNLLIPYIQHFYKFFVGIAGIVAVFMIMYGGVQWLFSGGNPTKITSAQETIVGAVAGLFLALGSYVLLIQINPELVKFNFNISPIETSTGCYNLDGSLKEANQLACGEFCKDQPGNMVIGECNFCNPSTPSDDTYNSCGVLRKNDSCSYAACGNAYGPRGVCSYIGDLKNGESPWVEDIIKNGENVFGKAHCVEQFSLKPSIPWSRDTIIFTYSGNLQCGKLNAYRDNGGVQYIFGISCASNVLNCTIDLSEGYVLNPEVFGVNEYGNSDWGGFNKAECK